MSEALVVLSGGQDSTTCLFWAKDRFDHLHAVTIDYGQRHRREIDAAREICRLANVSHEVIRVPNILVGTSPLVNQGSSLEQYKDWQSLPGGLEKTFVPMRNMFFLTIAANRALARNCNTLVTGVCQEDFGGYPDCRAVFIFAVEAAIRLGSSLDEKFEFTIRTPLMDIDKAASVKLALEHPGCYAALGWSHTSYDGQYPPTGHDHATLLRAKGFEKAGVPDPLVIRAYWEHLMPLPETSNYQNYATAIKHIGDSVWSDGIHFALGQLAKEF